MNSNTLILGRSRAAASPQPARAFCRAFRASAGLALALLLPAAALPARAATVAWSGASGTDTNWSNGNNWSGLAVPTSSDDVKFLDVGTNSVPGVPDNLVDGGFAGVIGSLQYASSNGFHTTFITNGATVNVIGSGGLTVGTLSDLGSATIVNETVTGPGTLMVSNVAAPVIVDQGRSANGNGTQRAILDMSGLGAFVGNLSRIGVGTTTLGGANNAQNATGTLKLARTNTIATWFSGSAITATPATPTNSIDVGSDNGNAGGVNFLFLGQTNAFFIDSIGVGSLKTTASMLFNSAFANPAAYFRGTNGDSSRVRFWTIGDMSSSGSSSSQAAGTNDFSGGTVDLLVDTMSLGRDRVGGNTGSGTTIGTLTFTAGTIDVNNLLVGNQAFSTVGNKNPMTGVVNVNGANATLVVNKTLTLGNTTVASQAATNTTGILNVRDGTVRANNIAVGVYSTVNTISMTNGTLVLSNTLASAAKGLTTFNITNSTLQLNVTGVSPIITVTNLVTGGSTNIISLATTAVFASYPTQLTLVKYSGSIGGAGYNFGFGAGNLPATAQNAYLSNNVANKSIDVVLPVDPRPVITAQPFSYAGNPGDTATFTTAVSGVPPLYYQWQLSGTNLADGPTGTGSSLSGSTTNALTITSAQTSDSGTYTLLVTNAYGSASASADLIISTGSILPQIQGLANQTVIAGNTAVIAAHTIGKPLPTLQWQFNGTNLTDGPTGNGDTLSGSGTSTLTDALVQYPSSQGTYSLIASNEVGSVTNSMVLTVIVAPVIAVQPQPLVVTNGNSASFSVISTNGVPAAGFQWLKNGVPIPNATSATYSIANAAPTNMGAYSVVIANTAGSVVSTSATLIVNSSTLAGTVLLPANGAVGVGYDTPLYLTFNQAPALRNGGAIRIYNATNSSLPVDTLDMSLNLANAQSRTIGGDNFNSFPVIITGNTAAIYPHSGVMTSNQTYYVLVDDGVFADSTGAYFAGIAAINAWQFSTKPGGPANPTNLVVAADGSGDFVTVQGAIDSVPANNTAPTLINIRNGIYTEIIDVKSKNNLTFRGQTRNGAAIAYPNNNNLNSTGAPLRAMVVLNGNDCAFENITVTNSTPKGGSQAEALDVEGTRCILYNMELDSYQDTFLVHSAGKLVYFQDCLVQGDTDFNWGYGTVFYTNCEIRCLSTGSHVTQPRSPLGSNGFSFVNCQITKGGSSVTSADLGRSISTPTTPSEVIFIRCLMDDVITGYSSDAGPNFWYASCSNLTATVEKTSLTFATHLAGNDPTVLLAQDATNWLYGWVPQMAPNLLTNPVGRSVAGGAALSLNAYATGIPSPAYQWLKNGEPMPGQTASTLTIPSANVNDAGSYSVIVSNAAGVITSTAVTVTVGNTAPTLASIADQTVNVGVMVKVSPVATDPDVPPQTLTFSLTSAPPAGSTFDTTTGAFNWRPNVSQAGTTYPVSIVVADNGTPILSATQSFNVIVNPLTQPNLTAPLWNGSQFSLTVNGQTGPDYIVMVSTNLVDWMSVFTNSSPVMPFSWTDPNSGLFPVRFYRIQPGPLP
jgi:pectin methylesterase-like acyl-CoA thioesterase